jgi:hypothetical protein
MPIRSVRSGDDESAVANIAGVIVHREHQAVACRRERGVSTEPKKSEPRVRAVPRLEGSLLIGGPMRFAVENDHRSGLVPIRSSELAGDFTATIAECQACASDVRSLSRGDLTADRAERGVPTQPTSLSIAARGRRAVPGALTLEPGAWSPKPLHARVRS